MRRKTNGAWLAMLCVLVCALGTGAQVLDDMIAAFEGGDAMDPDLAQAIAFYKNRPIGPWRTAPTTTALEARNRPWRNCANRMTSDKWPAGGWGEPPPMNVARWFFNEAFMCRDSQRNWIVDYELHCEKVDSILIDGCELELSRPQFEVDGKMVLPVPPGGRLAKLPQDIVPCDLYRKEPCWQDRRAEAQAVAPSASVPQLFSDFCWAGDLLKHQHGKVPELCYPPVAYQGKGCEQENVNRACYVEDDAEYVVIAHFPWQVPDGTTTYSAGKLNGPAKVSRSDNGWAVETLAYTTGSPGECRVCTTGNTLGGFALDRVMSMPEQRAFEGMDSCAAAPGELAGEDMYMHAYESNQQLDVNLVSATRRTHGESMWSVRDKVRQAFEDKHAEGSPDASSFAEASQQGINAARAKLLKEAYKDCPSTESLTIQNPIFAREGTQVLDDPCELVRYKGDIPKQYSGVYSDIEPQDESLSYDIVTRRLTDAGAQLSEHVLCPYAFSAGCVSWFNSHSRHVCSSDMIGKRQLTVQWLKDLKIDAALAEVYLSGPKQELLVFVPSMATDAGFSSAYKLGLVQWTASYEDGQVTYLSRKYSIPPMDGSRIVVVDEHAFQIDILLIDAEASEDKWHVADVVCSCDAKDTQINVQSPSTGGMVQLPYMIYGAVMRVTEADGTTQLIDSPNTGLFHECRVCSGREFRKSDPFKRQVCGAVTHTCAPCRESIGSENSLRSADGLRCIVCPRAHIVNQWSSLRQLLRLAGEQYGWTYDEDEWRIYVLRRLQSFGSQATYDHIRNNFIQDGEWTCHLCPVGYVLVQNVLSFECRLLNVLVPELDTEAQSWRLSASCAGDALKCDEVAIDEERTVSRVINVGSYLVIDVEQQQVSEKTCPTGEERVPNDGVISPPLHTGLFHHLCGRPYSSVYLRVMSSSCDPGAITDANAIDEDICDWWPRAGEKHILDTTTNQFKIKGAAGLLDNPRSYYPTLATTIHWEIVREGSVEACTRCATNEYNSGCSNDNGGAFGVCMACKASPAFGTWLDHVLPDGCRSWFVSDGVTQSGSFVDRDYEEKQCRNVVQDDAGDLFLLAGFCGRRQAGQKFRWWKYDAGSTALVQKRECDYPGTDTDPDCVYNGNELGAATQFEEYSTLVPYCPPGFYVNTDPGAGCALTTILSQPFLVDGTDAKCCTLCEQACPEEQMRSSTWQVCPGYTTYDTQDACTAGCDIGYYKQVEIANAGAADEVRTETCAPCTSCEAGLNAV